MDTEKTTTMTIKEKSDKKIKAVPRQRPIKRLSTQQHRRNRLFSIGEATFMAVRNLNKQPCVNIRNYNRDEHGRLCSTKRGILLSSEEWKALKEQIAVIDDQLQQRHVPKAKTPRKPTQPKADS